MPSPCAGVSGQGRCSGSWWRVLRKPRWQSTAGSRWNRKYQQSRQCFRWMKRCWRGCWKTCVRHNPKPVNITVHTRQAGERFCLTVADDGIGYPAAVLEALKRREAAENAPHILGLYVVQQIAAAHLHSVGTEHPPRCQSGGVPAAGLKIYRNPSSRPDFYTLNKEVFFGAKHRRNHG